MKYFFLTLTIILFLGCGSDNAPTNTNTASRSMADYMLDGPVGTEYWYSQVGIRTDTNGRTGILRRDTIVWTILNRAYNHPILGNCIQVKEYRKFSNQMQKKGVKEGSDALDGLLFEDVKLYESEHTVDGELGVEKCIKKCKGMCVEYGMTSDAFCFPEDYADISKKYTETIKSEMGFRQI